MWEIVLPVALSLPLWRAVMAADRTAHARGWYAAGEDDLRRDLRPAVWTLLVWATCMIAAFVLTTELGRLVRA